MPVTEKKYPEWVQMHRTKGMTVKKKGDAYYLYKRTSRRVPGKKYPQPVDTYVGVITPDGVIVSDRKKVPVSDIEVWEYGFSKAIWELCPEDWKKPLGGDWEDVLRIILLKWSPQSYVGMGSVKKEEDFRWQFPTQMASLNRRLRNNHKVDIKNLEELKGIYLVKMGEVTVVSRIGERQEMLINSLGLDMGV